MAREVWEALSSGRSRAAQAARGLQPTTYQPRYAIPTKSMFASNPPPVASIRQTGSTITAVLPTHLLLTHHRIHIHILIHILSRRLSRDRIPTHPILIH